VTPRISPTCRGSLHTIRVETMETNEPTDVVTGMWVTADGHIRQELRPDGRYDEARGHRRSAYTGSYTVTPTPDGPHLFYRDDLGFTATGDIRDGVLYHEHLVLYPEPDTRHPDTTTMETE
jgi:hypothetical protein